MTAAAVRRWLIEHTPLEPALLEGAGFESLVAERSAAAPGGAAAYLAALGASPEEVDRLVAGIAVPETWLFRYPRSFELLVEFLERRLASGAAALRMLSVGCATGQEPYCMAMAALHAGWPAARISVGGLDRNREFLRAAATAEYGTSSIRTEIPAWAVPFLRHDGETIGIDPAVRAAVWFRQVEAVAPEALPAGPFDAIFCRNLLIYLNAASRRRLIDAIAGALAIGGLFFTGHAEQSIAGTPSLRGVPAPHAFALERIEPAAAARARPAASDERRAMAAPRRAAAPAAPPASRPPSAPAPADTLEAARGLADAGRLAESEAMIRSHVARHGPNAPALELLGVIRMAAGDETGAKRLFEQAVYLEPARATSLLQLAISAERAGDAQRAAIYWDRARRAGGGAQEDRA
jgi:chemotaxis protein methyltransferase WspC